MDKSLPAKSTPAQQNLRQAWEERYMAHVAESQRRLTDTPEQNSQKSSYGLIGGFILLQLVALLVALIFLIPTEPSTRADIVAPASLSQVNPVEPEPPPPTPQVFQTPQINHTSTFAEEAGLVSEPNLAHAAALRLRGMEITQGIQVFNEPELPPCQPNPNHPNYIFCNNSIPLVAGRHTLVRVYVACNEGCPTTETTVRLRLLKDGQEQANLTRSLPADTLRHLNNLAMPELRLHLENSINFEFLPPPAWLTGQITFALEVMPQGEIEQAPALLTLVKEFSERRILRIAYLPIEHQGRRPPELAEVDYWLRRLYPVPNVEYYRLPVPDLVWQGEIDKGQILRQLLYTYWLYTQYNPPDTWPDQLFGWLPPESYNGGAADPFWCPTCTGLRSSRVAFGGLRPERDIGGPRILVHEIAHNLGALHAWSPTQREDAACFKAEGTDISVDPYWPYAYTPYIQEIGLDLYSNPPIVYPPATYDIMAYCTQPWISPYTYRKIFNSSLLQPGPITTLPLFDFKSQPEPGNNSTLLVSGVIYSDGTVAQPEVMQLEQSSAANHTGEFTPPLAFEPPPGDDYCLEAQTSAGITLTRRCFDAGFVDGETGLPTEASPFFLTLPEVTSAEVSKIIISRNETPLVTLTPSKTPPQVSLTWPNGGEILTDQPAISWQASDADGDTLFYDLLYSPDAGQSWLPLAVRLSQSPYTFDLDQIPASQAGLIRVIAHDGFYTSLDESDAPFVVNKPTP